MFDFNDADKQGGDFELIPAGTEVPVMMALRPGGHGEGGWLRQSNAGDKLMLDCEFTVTSGEYANRKFWGMMVVEGSEKAANISRATLRAILEATRGIDPNDQTTAAQQARVVTGWGDFNAAEFIAKVGIERGKDGYADKNKLQTVVHGQKATGTAHAFPRGHTAEETAKAAQALHTTAPGRPAWAS